MSETVNTKELIQCARCKSTMLVKYFSINKKGKLYKTCDNCREKRKITIKTCHKVAEERGGKCLSTEYTNNKGKMLWKCSEGHQWSTCLSHIKNSKSWCPECAIIKNGIAKRCDIEICHKVAEEHEGKCLSSEYKDAHALLLWECSKGHQWNACYSAVRKGHWCAECVGLKKKTIDECHKVAEERGGKCLSTEYKNSKEKMLWECSEGHTWHNSFGHIKNRQQWCPKCAIIKNGIAKRCDIKECHQVAEERGGKCLSTKYITNREKMLWECSDGHQWEACFSHINLSKSWCPYCAGSRSEELARELMKELYGEKFKKVRPEWLEGLELDGYNEDLKIGFEYNGIQHYQYRPHFHRNGIEDLYKQQKNDHKKYEICKERGIHLIVIPNQYSYQDEDEMRNFLEKNL